MEMGIGRDAVLRGKRPLDRTSLSDTEEDPSAQRTRPSSRPGSPSPLGAASGGSPPGPTAPLGPHPPESPAPDGATPSPAASPHRSPDQTDDIPFMTVGRGRRRRRGQTTTPTATTDPAPSSHFTVEWTTGWSSTHAIVMALEAAHPGQPVTSRITTEGTRILSTTSQALANLLPTLTNLSRREVRFAPHTRTPPPRRYAVMGVEADVPPDWFQGKWGITAAHREVNRDGPTSCVVVTTTEDLPRRIQIGEGRPASSRLFVPDPPQCYQCHRWGHVRRHCTHSARCYHCGRRHQACPNPPPSKKCLNCGGGHATAYRGCPTRLALVEALHTKMGVPSRQARAAAPQDAPAPRRRSARQPQPVQSAPGTAPAPARARSPPPPTAPTPQPRTDRRASPQRGASEPTPPTSSPPPQTAATKPSPQPRPSRNQDRTSRLERRLEQQEEKQLHQGQLLDKTLQRLDTIIGILSTWESVISPNTRETWALFRACFPEDDAPATTSTTRADQPSPWPFSPVEGLPEPPSPTKCPMELLPEAPLHVDQQPTLELSLCGPGTPRE